MASLEGLQQFIAEVRRIGRDGVEAVKGASVAQAEQLLQAAKARIPVKSGALRDSGRVRKTKRGVDVTFGNKSVPYANYQHEHVGLQHAQGGAKYLEGPMLQQVPQIGEAWQEAFLKVLGD